MRQLYQGALLVIYNALPSSAGQAFQALGFHANGCAGAQCANQMVIFAAYRHLVFIWMIISFICLTACQDRHHAVPETETEIVQVIAKISGQDQWLFARSGERFEIGSVAFQQKLEIGQIWQIARQQGKQDSIQIELLAQQKDVEFSSNLPLELIGQNIQATDASTLLTLTQAEMVGEIGYYQDWRLTAKINAVIKGDISLEKTFIYHHVIEKQATIFKPGQKRLVSFNRHQGRWILPDVGYDFVYR